MNTRELGYSVYFDKVYGGWVGKCIGGAIGAQVEGQKKLHEFTEETAFPEKWPPNDDLDLQVLWLHAIEDRGIFITSRDLAEEWVEHSWYFFNEYGRFLKNFARGIEPPISGWFDNEYFRESMGCPIRSEIWGFICPGNPSLAASYAEKDGTLDHWKGSVWAEQFFSAIEAALFFESDINKLIDVGLNYVPEGSKLRGVIELVKDCRRRGLSWREARMEVLRKFGNPDPTSVYQNIGFTLIALLWGEYDFGQTMLIALNCGYDTDCTCATAGAILGGILGEKRIPAKWKAPLKDEFEMGFKVPRESYKIADLAHETCAVGIAISRVLNKGVRIADIPAHVMEMSKHIPVGRPTPEVEILVDYLGLPAISKGEEKVLEIKIKNNRTSGIYGTLKLEVPEGWSASDPVRVIIPPHEVRAYRFNVKAPVHGVLWDKNILRAVLSTDQGEVWRRDFGLCGARLWRLLGPFWESPSWIADVADIEKSYVNESLITSGRELELFKDALEFSSPESKLPLDDVLGFKGEYCVYLLHRLVSPDERDVSLVIGASGDVRVWLNGRLLSEREWRFGAAASKYIWNPVMHWFDVRLRKGENRVVIKYVKKTKEAELSFDVHKENKERIPGYSIWQVDLGSALG